MPVRNRDELKKYFVKGSFPLENHFRDLIDSVFHATDDGVEKKSGEAMRIREEGVDREVLRFFRRLDDAQPAWVVGHQGDKARPGLVLGEPVRVPQEGGPRVTAQLCLQPGGNVGVGTGAPAHKLEVEGTVGMKGRTGTYAAGEVPADGEWHDILTRLDGCRVFEVVATVGETGAHVVAHVIAAQAYGTGRGSITRTQGRFGGFWNRLRFRWRGTDCDYQLQVRTRRSYGPGVQIRYHVTDLLPTK